MQDMAKKKEHSILKSWTMFLKNFRVNKSERKSREIFQIRGIKETWQSNTISDPRLDFGLKEKKNKKKTNDKQLYWANSITEKSDNWLNTSIILVQNALKLLIALQLCEQIFLFLQNKQQSIQEERVLM